MANDLLDTQTADLFGADVAAVTVFNPDPAPILAVTGGCNKQIGNSSPKNEPVRGGEVQSTPPHHFGDVASVTPVTPNGGAGFSLTADETEAVTPVTGLADLIEAAITDADEDAEPKPVQSLPENAPPP